MLSPMITNKSTMELHSTATCNDPIEHSIVISAEIKKNSAFNSAKSCSHSTQSNATNIFLGTQFQLNSKVEFCLERDQRLESEEMEHEQENVFCIKGVIPHCDLSPSWLHPTNLYSCLGYETSSVNDGHTDCKMDVSTCSSGLLQQLLMMVSNKGLNMVVEFHDPESSMPAIGVLQPVTSVCAVLSVVKREMLLMIEKLLLWQNSHGHFMVSRDITSLGASSANTLPVDLCHNGPLSSSAIHKDLLEERALQQSKQCKVEVSCPQDKGKFKDQQNEKIITSFIRDCNHREGTKRKQGNKLLLLLNNYYSGKQVTSEHGHSKETNMQGPLMRGRLCQETSQKCEAMPSRDGMVEPEVLQSKPEVSEKPEANMSSSTCTLDVKQIDDVKTVDDLKAILDEGYWNCVNLDQSAAVFSSRTFEMIDHLKSSGELKDFEQIMAILKSSVLRDNKTLREIFESNGETTDKDKIVQEYKVQVFLRLELANRYEEVDKESVADEITVMLRAISFQKDPIYLKSFLKNSIITRYSGNLAKLLCFVYDGLMQKPPKEILSPSHQVSSEEDTPLKSRKVPSVSSKSESVEETKNTRALVRRHSVMDVPSKRREIALPMKTKSTKNRDRDKEKRQTRSAGKKSSTKAPRKPVTPVKKVRRNLFTRGGEGDGRRTSPRKQPKTNTTQAEGDKLTRRHTITSFSHLKKVVDTPVCKQVSCRMLHRQEWARRRSKTVTDVTIVGESPLKDQGEEVIRPFPRKNPRRQTATFYSSSTGSFRVLRNSTVKASKVAGKRNEDTYVSEENSESTTEKAAATKSKRLHRALSIIGNLPTSGTESNTRRGFRQFLNLKESTKSAAEKIPNDESFTEVFIDAVKPCDDPDKTAVVSSKPDASLDSPTENTYEVSLIQSPPIFTRQVKSSPSISKSSPVVSFPSPSQSRCSLVTSKSDLSTSPILFQSPQIASKLSPSTFNAEQIFDIAIPLTPFKSPLVKVVKSVSKTCSSKKCCDTEKCPKDADKCSRCLGNSRSCGSPSCRLEELQCNDQVNCYESDSEGIVGVSSRLGRKRSLITEVVPSTTNSKDVEVSENNFADNLTRIAGMNNKNGGYSNTRDSEGQISDHGILNQNSEDVSSSVQQETEVFMSPVATKRKRLTSRERTSESVSPLNQILKQRKNHRNTSGTSRKLSSKPKPALDGDRNKRDGRSTEVKQSSPCHDGPDNNLKAVHITSRSYRKEVAEQFEEEESYEKQDSVQKKDFANEPTDVLLSSPHDVKSRNRTSYSDFNVKFCPLQPHFTPMALSAKSLEHLKESPVLIGLNPQSSDCFSPSSSSPSRKWSERRSPMDTSPKRLCHDPMIELYWEGE